MRVASLRPRVLGFRVQDFLGLHCLGLTAVCDMIYRGFYTIAIVPKEKPGMIARTLHRETFNPAAKARTALDYARESGSRAVRIPHSLFFSARLITLNPKLP